MKLPERTVFTEGSVYSTAEPFATALVVEDGMVAWIGPSDSARVLFPPDATTVHVALDGQLITPSFVNLAHLGDPPADPAASGWQRLESQYGVVDVHTVDPLDGSAHAYLSHASSGEPLIFASPESSCTGWQWVYAASYAAPAHERISDRAAFLAATRAPRRALAIDHPGALNPGVAANLVIWEPWPLIVHANDERIETWSTDPRSRTPLLPDLSDGLGLPTPQLTIEGGYIAYLGADNPCTVLA